MKNWLHQMKKRKEGYGWTVYLTSPNIKHLLEKLAIKCVSYIIYFFTYSSFLALPTLFLEDIFVLRIQKT